MHHLWKSERNFFLFCVCTYEKNLVGSITEGRDVKEKHFRDTNVEYLQALKKTTK